MPDQESTQPPANAPEPPIPLSERSPGSVPRPARIQPPPPPPDVVAHSAGELTAALSRPFRALELVLADQARVAKDIVGGVHVAKLIAILLGVSVLFTIPYGLVLDLAGTWRIAALFLGSVAVCLPSLHVFSNFIGIRIDAQRNIALTLLVTSVAAAFSFGFFPILWFLQATMADGEAVDLGGLSVLFLSVCLFAGVTQLMRCLGIMSAITGERRSIGLIAVWLLLLVFVSFRMARALGLMA